MNGNEQLIITGCSGRIGKTLIERLGDKYQIIGLDTHKAHYAHPISFFQIDISSPEKVHSCLEAIKQKHGSQLASVIHLAAYYSFSQKHPELYDKITVQGTENLLKALQSFQVDQFLFSSTILVHAPCQLGQTINENSPLEPKWLYPESKVKTEKVIHENHGSISAVIMRIAGCYDDLCHSIPIAHNIQRIYEQDLIDSHFYPGDLSHGNPFLHLEDLADAISLAIVKRKHLPKELTVLIGEDRTMGYGEMQQEISHLLNGKSIHVYRIPKAIAKAGAWIQDHTPFIKDTFIEPWMIDLADDHYAIDITRARTVLGWEPKHYIRNVLPLMIEALKKDPLSWYKTNGLEITSFVEKKAKESHAKIHAGK